MTLHIQFTPDGRHIRRWSREPLEGATMAEAGRLAADELELVVRRG
jgi:hypothetical protein